jgi:hypothetical protein
MRHFLILAAAITATLQAADPALLNLVMPDATVLAGINVQKAKTTPFGQFLLTQLPTGDSLNSFIESKNSGLVLARGTFSPAKISSALARDTKHTSEIYNGVQLITATAKTDGGAVAFLSPEIAVVGDQASVKAAIDRRGANNAIDPALAAKVAGFAAADAWSVTSKPISFEGNDNPIAGALKTVQQASGSIMLTSPVQISAEALAASDQDATSLSDVLKFVVMMMQGNAQASLLNGLAVSTDHSTIKIQLTIPEDQLEELIKGNTAKKPLSAHV